MSRALRLSSVLVLRWGAWLQKGLEIFLSVKPQKGHVDEKISPEPLLT